MSLQPHAQNGKKKEHSSDVRQVIVDLHIKGKSYRIIGKQLNLHPCTVEPIIRKWKEQDFTINCPRTGTPRKLSSCVVSRIVRFVKNHPRTTRKELVKDLQTADIEVTPQTVSNALCQHGLRSCSARKVLLLKKTHMEARLKLTNHHVYKPTSFWNDILRFDETKI